MPVLPDEFVHALSDEAWNTLMEHDAWVDQYLFDLGLEPTDVTPEIIKAIAVAGEP